jgi:hypothetical protein
MTDNEKLQTLFKNLETMVEFRTLTKARLEEFWEEASQLAEEDETIDKEMLENVKALMIALTSEMEFKLVRVTRSSLKLSKIPNPDPAQVSNIKPMLVLWTGLFAGAATFAFMKKPLNPLTKTVLTTFAAKAADIGFDKAYEEFKTIDFEKIKFGKF